MFRISMTSTIYVIVVFMRLLASFCSLIDPANVSQKPLFLIPVGCRKDAYSCISEKLTGVLTYIYEDPQYSVKPDPTYSTSKSYCLT